MAYFQQLLTKTEKSSWDRFLNQIWDGFVIWVRDWFGEEIETRSEIAVRRIGIEYILDQILDTVEDPEGTFDKTVFIEEFNKNFSSKLQERFQTRFEGGHFQLYDKTRAFDDSKVLETPEAICGAIVSIAYHAMDDIKANQNIKEQIIAQLKFVIQGKDDTDPKQSEFLTNLMIAYADTIGTLKLEKDEVIDIDKLTNQFMKAFEGGVENNVLAKYTDIAFEPISLNKEPEVFITQMIAQIRTMIENGQLNPIDNENEIMFPMRSSGHTFLLRPDMAMLNEAMKAPSLETWIAETIKKDGKLFIIADLNWETGMEHSSLAIKWDEDGNKLKFVCVREAMQGGVRREVKLPGYDSNHKFGDDGFTVLFLEKQFG